MYRTIIAGLLAATATVGAAGAATTTLTSSDFAYNNNDASFQPLYSVVISDEKVAGQITFDITIDTTNGPTADLAGFAFNSALTGLTSDDIIGTSITNFTASTDTVRKDKCEGKQSGGCNFAGSGSTFDYLFGFGKAGAAGGNVTELSFGITTGATLAQAMFDTIGIRTQNTNGTDGSTKDVGTVGEIDEIVDVAPVPLPAGGLLLVTGLGAFAAMRRGRRKA
ncbi:putative secreted protein [Palleronia aestuarii]|uniref:Putative secreted protein n=1 Tax=Palleronia aestuarii TaxID=568105 RepID=A0A2W7NNP0_9RHOB|nr:VPLPA-CTERM sorting domain-containing protein [Palleronia aestuarii]PZX19747.1 putative secreted protein [Palleronia aestuarii]